MKCCLGGEHILDVVINTVQLMKVTLVLIMKITYLIFLEFGWGESFDLLLILNEFISTIYTKLVELPLKHNVTVKLSKIH